MLKSDCKDTSIPMKLYANSYQISLTIRRKVMLLENIFRNNYKMMSFFPMVSCSVDKSK